MNYWFIRLGTNQYPKDKALYQALAREYSIVKIGYGITKDLTKDGEAEIKKYLKNRGDLENAQVSKITSLINTFVNVIRVGDYIISPFDEDYMRIGKVKSKCGTVNSFFRNKTKLKNFLKKHPGDERQGDQKIKPARKVEWVVKNVTRDEFPERLKSELSKFMPATVTSLKVEEIIDLSDIGNPVKVVASSIADNKIEIKRQKKINRNWQWRAIFASVVTVILSAFGEAIGESFVNSCAREIECESWFSWFWWLWHKLQEIIMFFWSILWSFWEWVIFPFPFSIEILIGLIGFAIAEGKTCGHFLVRFRVIRVDLG